MEKNEQQTKRIIDIFFILAAIGGCLASLIVGAINVSDANNINDIAGTKIIDTAWYWIEIFLMPFIYAGTAFVLDVIIKKALFIEQKPTENKNNNQKVN